jgi:hypothetical protein
MKYPHILAFALLLPLLSMGQEAPRTIKAPLYTLQIDPARDPASTSTAQGERLLQCKGCTVYESYQALISLSKKQRKSLFLNTNMRFSYY